MSFDPAPELTATPTGYGVSSNYGPLRVSLVAFLPLLVPYLDHLRRSVVLKSFSGMGNNKRRRLQIQTDAEERTRAPSVDVRSRLRTRPELKGEYKALFKHTV